jgi:carotenoid cleavage dioxygenase
VGLYDYGGALQPGDALTAHPKICPDTGDLVSCTQRWDSPNYWVQVFDAKGVHKQTIPVEFPRKGIIHDLQITENYIVIFYAPSFHSLEKAMKGEDPFIWEPEKGTRIIAIPRSGSGENMVFETDASTALSRVARSTSTMCGSIPFPSPRPRARAWRNSPGGCTG